MKNENLHNQRKKIKNCLVDLVKVIIIISILLYVLLNWLLVTIDKSLINSRGGLEDKIVWDIGGINESQKKYYRSHQKVAVSLAELAPYYYSNPI